MTLTPSGSPPAHGKIKLSKTQLLEEASGEQQRLDFGEAKTASGVDQNMETVGKIDRAKNRGRKQRSAKRGYKGGNREKLREISRLLREQLQELKAIHG